MDELIQQASAALSLAYKRRAFYTFATFTGGGVFGVLCFVAGYVAK